MWGLDSEKCASTSKGCQAHVGMDFKEWQMDFKGYL